MDQLLHLVVDDVTKHNMGLITRLRNCKELESAWYFNCSVYGKTFDEKRIKFDIFDDINNKFVFYNISYFFIFLLRIVHDFDVKFPGVLLVIIRDL
jgi:hypothetical protein